MIRSAQPALAASFFHCPVAGRCLILGRCWRPLLSSHTSSVVIGVATIVLSDESRRALSVHCICLVAELTNCLLCVLLHTVRALHSLSLSLYLCHWPSIRDQCSQLSLCSTFNSIDTLLSASGLLLWLLQPLITNSQW